MMPSLIETQTNAFARVIRYGFYLAISVLTIAGLFHYAGHFYIYLLFSAVSNALLYVGFRKNAIFFDAFIGVFFWIGFWLKLTVRVIFFNGMFHEAVGDFDGTGAAFDHALLVASCGLLGLLIASFVRERFIFKYQNLSDVYAHAGIQNFYRNYRNYILVGFAVLILSVALTNMHYGIYQRGEIAQTILPFGLNGIYKWLLLFGLASFTAVILQNELLLKQRISYTLIILGLLEGFASNISLLSRGMILNVSALVYGIYVRCKLISLRIRLHSILASFVLFIALFVTSVLIVNYIRATGFNGFTEEPVLQLDVIKKIGSAEYTSKSIFLDRWVGIEGVMAVSSNSKVGWDTWQAAWKEKYTENTMTFYDRNLIDSPYSRIDFTKKHYVSLPGIVAFFYYPGSVWFLFGSMFLLGLLAALIEISVFKLGGHNLILCSLLAEVVAYRFASFGYVPAQSYLLFGTIFLNLFIIYLFDKFIGIWNGRK